MKLDRCVGRIPESHRVANPYRRSCCSSSKLCYRVGIAEQMTFSSPLGSVISVSSSSNSPSGRQESLAFIRFDQLHLAPFRLFDTDIRAPLHDVAIIPERDECPSLSQLRLGGCENRMSCPYLGPIRSQSGTTSVQLSCTRSMENCPDSFVIAPATLHDPSQFALMRASP
jgi:hypothetical protein